MEIAKSYYRIMLGRRNAHAKEAHEGNYIGAGWFESVDLTNRLPDNWREFNNQACKHYRNHAHKLNKDVQAGA